MLISSLNNNDNNNHNTNDIDYEPQPPTPPLSSSLSSTPSSSLSLSLPNDLDGSYTKISNNLTTTMKKRRRKDINDKVKILSSPNEFTQLPEAKRQSTSPKVFNNNYVVGYSSDKSINDTFTKFGHSIGHPNDCKKSFEREMEEINFLINAVNADIKNDNLVSGTVDKHLVISNALQNSEDNDYATILNAIPNLISEKEKKAKFVEKLVDMTCNIINIIWANLTVNPNAKVIPLSIFVRETLRRSRTSYSTLQATLFYLLRIKSKIDLIITTNANRVNQNRVNYNTTTASYNSSSATCCRRMFLAALVVASKYLQDCNYSNSAWSKISGLPVKEINSNEICFLQLIDYNLFISENIFKRWSGFLLKHIQDTLYNDCNNSGNSEINNSKYDDHNNSNNNDNDMSSNDINNNNITTEMMDIDNDNDQNQDDSTPPTSSNQNTMSQDTLILNSSTSPSSSCYKHSSSNINNNNDSRIMAN